MYNNRKLVREKPVRINVNKMELDEITQGADALGMERASFVRDAALVVARYIKAQGIPTKLSQIELRLNQSRSHDSYALVG
jgi:uncharacterized protein (DUF1778 family)